jgi:hypothetical protein
MLLVVSEKRPIFISTSPGCSAPSSGVASTRVVPSAFLRVWRRVKVNALFIRKLYGAPSRDGFGKPVDARSTPLQAPETPHEARGKFTVQAIYDAFVRIWTTHGWEGVTTRAVALETGIAVGTLYDTFPTRKPCSRATCAIASKRCSRGSTPRSSRPPSSHGASGCNGWCA